MKALSKAVAISLGIAAILLLIYTGCSDTANVPPTSTGVSTWWDGDNRDEAGPIDDADDEFQNFYFSFDDAVPVVTNTQENVIPATGGTITVAIDDQDRSFEFPARLTDSDWNVAVTVRKGVNLDGDNLEIYDLSPSYLAYSGSIELELQTDVTIPSSVRTDPSFNLYREFGGVYIGVSSACPDENGFVSLTLDRSTSYAVIYKGDYAESDTDAN